MRLPGGVQALAHFTGGTDWNEGRGNRRGGNRCNGQLFSIQNKNRENPRSPPFSEQPDGPLPVSLGRFPAPDANPPVTERLTLCDCRGRELKRNTRFLTCTDGDPFRGGERLTVTRSARGQSVIEGLS